MWGVTSLDDEQVIKKLSKKSEKKSTIVVNVLFWGLCAMFMGLFYGLNWCSSWNLFWRIVMSIVIAGGGGFVGAVLLYIILSPLINCSNKNNVKTNKNDAVVSVNENSEVAIADIVTEKTLHNIVLVDASDRKIDVIKVIREYTGLGLIEGKQAMEKGGLIIERVSKEDAEKIVAKLEAAGAIAIIE